MDAKTLIYSLAMPNLIVHPDGNVEHKYNFTPEQEETLRLVDEMIEHIKEIIFGA
jgi:hypothetical protein